MRRNRSRLALLGIFALALSVTAGLTISDAAVAKKKKKPKAGGTADITKAVGAAIPDATTTTDGMVVSTIDVGGKKFKGTRIRDVNVTLQTTGTDANSASDLSARLTAPNGATSWLFGALGLGGQSIGPLTVDDESANWLTSGPPRDTAELGLPYAGTAQPDTFSSLGVALLSVMDNGGVTGSWTLRVYDAVPPPGVRTSTLDSWRLTVVAGKPFKAK